MTHGHIPDAKRAWITIDGLWPLAALPLGAGMCTTTIGLPTCLSVLLAPGSLALDLWGPEGARGLLTPGSVRSKAPRRWRDFF
ncbi:hypothetical protein NEPTK9_000883 [Candidatus Neptunochlamydia vexilliferae]|uniref:Uncharacterized protein n=1 Tax=Candidatus Neptunichlamydia vexilliferae TaxID=1651774 RepID=A0ABS0AZ24_9BACT|nr:hypothetical protein [Candidatus Neptunochlamydia vexilliferae]